MQRLRNVMFVAIMLLVGCYDSFDDPTRDAGSIPVANITIAELNSAYRGETVSIVQDVVISGRITSSDKADNFYNSLVIQDDSGAVEIMTGVASSYTTYPIGYTLSVRLQGLALGLNRGVHQIGLMPAAHEYTAVDYISSKVLLDQHLFCGTTRSDLSPREVSIEQLTSDVCGELITIRSVVYSPLAADEVAVWAGYKRFADAAERVVYSYTSDFASFAKLPVPQGAMISLTGVLQYGKTDTGKDEFILKPRDENDFAR